MGDLRKDFVDLTSRANKLATVALTTSVLLFALLEQSLRERDAQLKELGHRARAASITSLRRRSEAEDRLNTIWHVLLADVPMTVQEAQIDEAPMLTPRAAISRRRPPLRITLSQADSLPVLLPRWQSTIDSALRPVAIKRARTRLRRERSLRGDATSSSTTVDTIQALCARFTLTPLATLDVAGATASGPTPPPAEPLHESIANPRDSAGVGRTSRLCHARAELIEARFEYATVTELGRRLALLRDSSTAARTKFAALRAEKASVPTPFGNFNVQPAVALLGLTIGCVLSHLFFLAAASGARTIAVAGGDDARTWPRTFWLGARVGPFRSVDTLPSALFQAAWLGLSVSLLIEALVRWHALDVMALPGRPFWSAVVVGLVAWSAARAWYYWNGAPVAAPTANRGVSRRTVINVGLLSVGAAVVLGALALRRFKRHAARHLVNLSARTVRRVPDETQWVGNRKSKTLHHRVACAAHLPRERNRSAGGVPLDDFQLHRGRAVHCADLLAQEAFRAGDIDAAERIYALALDQSPFSFHIYDRLIRLYGRTRQHSKIPAVLERLRRVAGDALHGAPVMAADQAGVPGMSLRSRGARRHASSEQRSAALRVRAAKMYHERTVTLPKRIERARKSRERAAARDAQSRPGHRSKGTM